MIIRHINNGVTTPQNSTHALSSCSKHIDVIVINRFIASTGLTKNVTINRKSIIFCDTLPQHSQSLKFSNFKKIITSYRNLKSIWAFLLPLLLLPFTYAICLYLFFGRNRFLPPGHHTGFTLDLTAIGQEHIWIVLLFIFIIS